jgi:hypothetical protein
MAQSIRLSHAQARLLFIASQGLPPSRTGSLADVVARTGFVRTLGGVDVYLAVRARAPGMTRADLDGAVARHELQVVPSVRGCIYLVARQHVPLALRIADVLSRARSAREHEKAGIRKGEVEALAAAALEALRARGPLTTDALRKALPEGSVRSLGEQGKKVGISSPLPGALRLLELDGRIERTLDEGRLDTERYLWRVARTSPFEGAALPEDPVALYARAAELFLRWAGASTLRTFAGWAGVSMTEAKAAFATLPLAAVEIDGAAEPGFALEEALPGVARTEAAAEALGFLPFEDNLIALHGGPAALTEPAHWGVEVCEWGGSRRTTTLGASKHMMLRPLIARGALAGLWEYDPKARSVHVGAFAGRSKEIRAAADETARFLANEIGHGRSFNLDTDAALVERPAEVRALAR